MADRFPLILNTSTNQIQEIPSGDNLDLTGVGINNVGVITSGNVQIGGATTDLVVTGDARITGILTVGTGSLTLDGPNNLVNVGTALTLGHTQGLQFHTQNLHSAGFEVNQINVSGASTIGGNLDANGDLDVDGHTNLDNVSVGGATTMSGNLRIQNAAPHIYLTDTDGDDYSINVNGGNFEVRSINANSSRLQILSGGTVRSFGNFIAAKDLDVDGHTNLDNLSVAGVSTFSGDVTIAVGTGGIFTLQGSGPSIELVDANANDDFRIHVNHGIFQIEDATSGNADRFKIDSSGVVTIPGNTDFGAGIDVTGNATVSGNLSVGGVLTYEDVTNVDSVGIVTARSGLRVTGGTSNFSGASHFVGIARFNETIVGTARTAIKLTCTDESTDTTTYPLFVAATTGDQFPKTGTNLSFNSANGTLTATTFSGSGASLTNLPAAQLSGTAAAINGSNITNVNAATLANITAGSFLRSDASDTFDCNGNNLTFDFDTSGRDSIQFKANGSPRWAFVHENSGNDINIAKYNSAANIKINGARILTTADEGTGNGLDADTVDGIQGSNIVTLSGTQTINGTKNFNCSGYDVQLTYDSTRTLVSILRASTEKVRLHTSADTILVETMNSGVIRWKTGLVPNADDTYDLGATGTRWRNLYVNDLQLSNESKKDKGGNDVDGTWGDWTLQEGDENIFMLNNRTGKKYKINLTEVE